jgi:hypothetical protein
MVPKKYSPETLAEMHDDMETLREEVKQLRARVDKLDPPPDVPAATSREETLYRAFASVAKEYDPANGQISYQEVLPKMRRQFGVKVSTTDGPYLAQRFNEESGTKLFRLKPKTVAQYQGGVRMPSRKKKK